MIGQDWISFSRPFQRNWLLFWLAASTIHLIYIVLTGMIDGQYTGRHIVLPTATFSFVQPKWDGLVWWSAFFIRLNFAAISVLEMVVECLGDAIRVAKEMRSKKRNHKNRSCESNWDDHSHFTGRYTLFPKLNWFNSCSAFLDTHVL